MKKFATLLVALVSIVTLVSPAASFAAGNSIQLINTTADGQQLNGDSGSPVVSEDGRYVAFSTGATNLLPPNAPANYSQVFVRDRFAGTTTLESVKPNGDFPTSAGGSIALSPNGRYLAFSGNFPGDYHSGQAPNVYLKDMQTGNVTLITPHYTVDAPPFDGFLGGVQGVSNDGRYVVFQSRGGQFIPGISDGYDKIYVRDTVNQTFTLVSSNAADDQANSTSFGASMSADGRYVMFGSVATNLDPNLPAYNTFPTPANQYIKDLQTGSIHVVSTGPNGEFGDARSFAGTISPDGTHIVFSSIASNFGHPVTNSMPNIYVKDLGTGQLTFVAGDGRNVPGSGTSVGSLSISGDNQHVLFIDAHNNDSVSVQDVLEWDQTSGQLNMITIPPTPGTFPSPPHNVTAEALTYDGQAVFSSRTSNLIPNDTNGAGDIFFYGSLPDNTPPTLGTPMWSANPKATTQTSTLTVPAADPGSGASGVASGEYFIGDTDPGQGNGATMNWDGANLTTSFGTNFQPGVYKISVRAKDAAGNWSAPVSDYLVVYDPLSLGITGKKTVIPSVADGDILPGLTSGQADKATFGFNVKYTNQGVINSSSDLMFDYSTGSHCNNPSKAQNCHDFALNASSINWLVIDGTNSSEGIFQGTANVTVDGVTTANPFRITALDGSRLSPTSADHFMLTVFAPGANPNTATPLYQVSQAVDRGNIKIR